jgi:membrane protease YdiL (CAAX protease family)
MVFSIGYPVMFLVVLAAHQLIPGQNLIERLPVGVDELSGLLLTLFALLPSAVYVTWAAEGRAGLRKLFRRVTRWRFGRRWWIFILAALPVLTVVSGLLLGDTLRPVAPAHLVLDQVRLLLINLLLVNLWEETAWAGVLQTRLERRHNVFVAAGLAAVPFGLMHWPLAFLGEFTATSALIGAAGLHRARPARASAGRLDHARGCGQRVGVRTATQRLQPQFQPQRHRRHPPRRRQLSARHLDCPGPADNLPRPAPATQTGALLPTPPRERASEATASRRPSRGHLMTTTATPIAKQQHGLRGFVSRHPYLAFLVTFNTIGQAAAFLPVIAHKFYGVELNVDLFLIVPTLLFCCFRRC